MGLLKNCVLGVCFGEYFDHSALDMFVRELGDKFNFLTVGTVEKSILGRDIPYISFGEGEKSVLYIGTHHGMEWITASLLALFAHEISKAYRERLTLFGISVEALFKLRRIYVIPMLNPDGVEYALHGLDAQNVLRNRVLAMKGGDELSHWQANARGVDLNHNYNAGFEEYKHIERELGIWGGAPTKYSGEYPESEPEVRSLCNFVRCTNPSLAISLHTQGEEIYYTSCGGRSEISFDIARAVANMTGYALSTPSGTAGYGGFTDWFIREFRAPALTLECGRGVNPLPFSSLGSIYSRLRRALITAPTLV